MYIREKTHYGKKYNKQFSWMKELQQLGDEKVCGFGNLYSGEQKEVYWNTWELQGYSQLKMQNFIRD